MQTIDIFLGAVLAFFIIRGIHRGFFRETLVLLGWIGGILAAIVGAPVFATILKQMFPGLPAIITPILAFVLIFLFVFFFSRLMARTLSHIFQTLHLGWLNRALGGVVGGAKGAIILSLFLLVLNLLPMQSVTNPLREHSVLYRPLEGMVPALFHFKKDLAIDTRQLQQRFHSIYKQGERRLKEEAIKRFLNEHADTTHTR